MENQSGENGFRLITFVNTYSYYRLIDSACPIKMFSGVFVDGGLQVKLHNVFYKNKVNRASFDFSSLAHEFFEYLQKNGLKAAFIGAKTEELDRASDNLRLKYPGLRIVYLHGGYFESPEDKTRSLEALKQAKPDAVVLGMGTPAQEEFALYLISRGLKCLIITCGGFLTQTAKKADYYHPVIKKLRLRWLQRFIEFKHVRRRLLIDYPKNIIRYFFDHLFMLLKK
jgi:N-acetylglucosaminyldiphosphoundecaprenol N-acetyl-beta-D-mannosaminyltransferase